MTDDHPIVTPKIYPLGMDALVIQFARTVSDAASAAVQFMTAKLQGNRHEGIVEIAPALASLLVRFDPNRVSRQTLNSWLTTLCADHDWSQLALPKSKRTWEIPVCFDGDAAPDLAEVADVIGCDPSKIIAEVLSAELRVLAIGFAPGQPYIGMLPEHWNIPRKSAITAEVPAGALVTAVRQLVLFANPSPTGWRQLGLTAFRPFDLSAQDPVALRAGDAMTFVQASQSDISALRDSENPFGGTSCKVH